MAKAAIFRAIEAQREAVNRNEKAVLRQLAKLWVPSYRYLQDQFLAVTALIKAKQDAGEPVAVEYLYSQQRYRTMMAEARRAISQYNRAVQQVITGAEADAAEIGAANGQQLISITEPTAPAWTRVNKREARIMSGMLSEPSPLSELLNKSWPETRDRIDQQLMIGISTGQGSNWIAQRMMEAAEIPEQRALLIARTEVNRAYRQANVEAMRSTRVTRGFRRMCYKPTACLACLMLDGEFYPVDSDPCDHPNGKCSFVPVTPHYDPLDDPEWQTGREWLEEQDEETQRRILGPARFDLWKQQGVDPRNMVYIKPNDVWGGSPAVRTLEELGFGYRGKFISYPTEHGTINKSREITPTSVNWDVILSPEWHEKFKSITDNEQINETLYQKALDILNHRQNTIFEDMHLIDSKTGKVVGSQTHSTTTDHSVPYNKSLTTAMEKYPGRLISIHNHATNLPPTGSDFRSNFERKYLSGVVICHNGDIYVYNCDDDKLSRGRVDFILNNYPESQWAQLFEELSGKYRISWQKR